MRHHFQLKNTVLLMALAAAYPLQAHALAGIAQFTAGEVNLRQNDGRLTALSKGGDINSGNAIVTGSTGRAQVKFTDGGLISLQPNTEFKIANYVDQADPKEDRFLVDLLRGSMRAITGLIGKRNRNNYKLTTTTATIGIRGSGFKVGYNPDGSVGITSELDKIEVCNQSGCIGLVAGESVRVIDNASAPIRTSQQAKVEPPNTLKDPITVGDKVDGNGKASIVAAVTPAPAPAPAPEKPTPAINTGTFTGMSLTAHYHNAPVTTSSTGTVVPAGVVTAVLDSGKLTQFSDANYSYKPVTIGTYGSLGNQVDGDFIGWGNWISADKDSVSAPGSPSALTQLHYVVGQPTAILPALTGVTVYSAVAATSPFSSYTGTSGVLNLATTKLNVDFSMGSMDAGIYTSLGNVTSSFTFSSSTFQDGAGSVRGFFAGTNANRAGLVYVGNDYSGTFTGAVVFQRP